MGHERLQRFVEAQDQGGVYEQALTELRAQPASLRKPAHIASFRRLGDLEVFERVLERYFGGEPDERTLGLL